MAVGQSPRESSAAGARPVDGPPGQRGHPLGRACPPQLPRLLLPEPLGVTRDPLRARPRLCRPVQGSGEGLRARGWTGRHHRQRGRQHRDEGQGVAGAQKRFAPAPWASVTVLLQVKAPGDQGTWLTKGQDCPSGRKFPTAASSAVGVEPLLSGAHEGRVHPAPSWGHTAAGGRQLGSRRGRVSLGLHSVDRRRPLCFRTLVPPSNHEQLSAVSRCSCAALSGLVRDQGAASWPVRPRESPPTSSAVSPWDRARARTRAFLHCETARSSGCTVRPWHGWQRRRSENTSSDTLCSAGSHTAPVSMTTAARLVWGTEMVISYPVLRAATASPGGHRWRSLVGTTARHGHPRPHPAGHSCQVPWRQRTQLSTPDLQDVKRDGVKVAFSVGA